MLKDWGFLTIKIHVHHAHSLCPCPPCTHTGSILHCPMELGGQENRCKQEVHVVCSATDNTVLWLTQESHVFYQYREIVADWLVSLKNKVNKPFSVLRPSDILVFGNLRTSSWNSLSLASIMLHPWLLLFTSSYSFLLLSPKVVIVHCGCSSGFCLSFFSLIFSHLSKTFFSLSMISVNISMMMTLNLYP